MRKGHRARRDFPLPAIPFRYTDLFADSYSAVLSVGVVVVCVPVHVRCCFTSTETVGTVSVLGTGTVSVLGTGTVSVLGTGSPGRPPVAGLTFDTARELGNGRRFEFCVAALRPQRP